jgi:hypothetical protein
VGEKVRQFLNLMANRIRTKPANIKCSMKYKVTSYYGK